MRSRPISQPDKWKKFKAYPIGYLQIDFAELRTETGKRYLFVAVGRTAQSRHRRVAPGRDASHYDGLSAPGAGLALTYYHVPQPQKEPMPPRILVLCLGQ